MKKYIVLLAICLSTTSQAASICYLSANNICITVQGQITNVDGMINITYKGLSASLLGDNNSFNAFVKKDTMHLKKVCNFAKGIKTVKAEDSQRMIKCN